MANIPGYLWNSIPGGDGEYYKYNEAASMRIPCTNKQTIIIAGRSVGATTMQKTYDLFSTGHRTDLQLPKDKNTLQIVENHLSSFYEEPVDFKLKTSLALINSEVKLTPFNLNWDNFPKLSIHSKGIYKEAIK